MVMETVHVLSKSLVILAIILALLLGVLLGRIMNIASMPIPPTVLREDSRPLVPVVWINGIENGSIYGNSHGDVRVFLGERIIVPNASGAFRVYAGDLLRESVAVRVPSGMRFVASRRGKKYYPVASVSAARLAPRNRVYFADRESAEHAGFLAGE